MSGTAKRLQKCTTHAFFYSRDGLTQRTNVGLGIIFHFTVCFGLCVTECCRLLNGTLGFDPIYLGFFELGLKLRLPELFLATLEKSGLGSLGSGDPNPTSRAYVLFDISPVK